MYTEVELGVMTLFLLEQPWEGGVHDKRSAEKSDHLSSKTRFHLAHLLPPGMDVNRVIRTHVTTGELQPPADLVGGK